MSIAVKVFRCGPAHPDRAMCELKISAFVEESVKQQRPSACVPHSSSLPSSPAAAAAAAASNSDRDDAPAKEHNAVDDRGTERRRDKWDGRPLNLEDTEQDLDVFQLKAIMRLPDPYRHRGSWRTGRPHGGLPGPVVLWLLVLFSSSRCCCSIASATCRRYWMPTPSRYSNLSPSAGAGPSSLRNTSAVLCIVATPALSSSSARAAAWNGASTQALRDPAGHEKQLPMHHAGLPRRRGGPAR
ncbi:hypothetical protein GH5_08540 [Leishmania sp. Ghana 2012 LV757]|uniref:hypothetical protein n=1 Tax=Leishmania sp. Ghana 2012 LV757 TaxID=2803181 RepID=UPI001B5583AF|nr:hypothetical protein GH5_08540 [Leishmania sp. Ghana 2012 LV757]